ncbi:MAG: polysaccharide biosynthesis tyrosine autokinase, partial [Desulfobacteraceae bacterium]|jgi:capsular exopolysaccharide synthesis family protein
MAQARMKVLLVGSDLRKPTVDKVFDVEMTPGLTDILMENYHWRDTVKTVMDMAMGDMTQTQIIRTPGLDNLHIITSGPIPPNPAELIDSKALTEFIEEAKEEYDMIIFDSPPILSTADAAILGAKVDGVLLVYRVGSVSRGLLKRSTAQLEQVKSNIMGVILNGMRPEVSPDFQDYKYYSYYYSYGEEGKEKRRRDQRKGWAFLGRKGEKESKEEQQEATLREEGIGSEKKEGKKGISKRLLLLFVATVILAVGILWHNGLIDPFKEFENQGPMKKEEKRKDIRKGVSKTPGARRPEKVSPKPKPALSKTEERLEMEDSMAKSPAASKEMADIEEPTMKKGTPEPLHSTGPETVSPRSEGMASVDKPAAKVMPSIGKGASETSVPKKPEAVSRKQESPLVPEKPEPPDVASIPKSPPVSTGAAVTETAPSPVKRVSYPYSLYLGSFQTLKRAKKAVSLYMGKGFSAYWVKVLLSKGTWYRVYIGYFEDSETAERFRQRHGLTETTIEKTPYANLIGRFSSSAEVEDKISYLRNLGYSPYEVKDPEGRFQVYVGAFYPEYRAERQYNELKSSGVQSRVVKR